MRLSRHFRYKAGNRHPDDAEDLYQEACCAALMRLRTAEDEAEAEKYFMQVHHAMFEHARRMAPVHFSEKRFTEGIRTVKTVRWQYVDEGELTESFEDELVENMDVHRFLDSLEPPERRIAALRMQGRTLREIAEICGVDSESSVSRMVKRIGEKYMAFNHEYRRAV